jgi:hypothetical protein
MCQLVKLFQESKPTVLQYVEHLHGDTFTLPNTVGLVMTGAIAIETLAEPANAEPVTIRLAASGEFLNLEQIHAPSAGAQRFYIVESKAAVIALLDIEYLRRLLQTGEPTLRLQIYERIAHGLTRHVQDIAETAGYFGGVRNPERLAWALSRLTDTGEDLPRILRERLASHAAVCLHTLHRLKRLIA